MMYNVLIVDDEALERSALENVLKGTFAQELDIIQAENGKIAVACAKTFRPDIVLMDIKMPGMNGIDAARCIKEMYSDVKIIMLTGFTYFHYAKECISIGVMDFIVKPTVDEVVVEIVQKAIKLIEKEKKDETCLKDEKEKIKLAERYLEGELLAEFLFGGATLDKKLDILSMLGVAHMNYTVAVVFRHVQYQQMPVINDVTAARIIQCQYHGRHYLLLCSSVEQTQTMLYDTLKQLGIEMDCEQEEMRMGISLSSNKIEQISELVQQAYLAYQQKQGIQFYTPMHVKQITKQKSLENDLVNLLKERRYTELINQLYPLMTALFMYEESPKEQLCDVLFALNRVASKVIKVQSTFTLYDQIIQLKDVEEIKHFVYNYIQELVDHMITEEASYQDEWVYQVQKILNEGYTHEITLEQVAKSVGFSTYYFSRLFKQTFGESFVDYLTHLRVEKAKTLLANPRTLVKTVCYEVGYNEPNYFTRVFKKETGLTPSEYQKSAIGANKY